MRLAALLLACLPMWAQVRASFEPLAEAETKRSTGVKSLTLWNVTVESNLPFVHRGDVERLTAFTELRPSMAEDLIRKASGANSLTLLGKGWDGGAGFVATGLSIAGYAAKSKEMALAGGAVALVTMFRNLLKGQAPDGTMYLPEFMPDLMPCKGGYCGNWLVLTSKIGKPEKVEVGALINVSAVAREQAASLLTAPAYLEAYPGCNCTQTYDIGTITLAYLGATRPQIPDVDEIEEVHQYAERIAALIRERSAQIGAGQ